MQDVNNAPWDTSDDEIAETPYACKGWRDDYRQEDRDGTLIRQDDVRIIIVVSSLAITPGTSDKITIGGATYSIISVRRDPAGTTFDVQARA